MNATKGIIPWVLLLDYVPNVPSAPEHEDARARKREFRAAVAQYKELHKQVLDLYDKERSLRERATNLQKQVPVCVLVVYAGLLMAWLLGQEIRCGRAHGFG